MIHLPFPDALAKGRREIMSRSRPPFKAFVTFYEVVNLPYRQTGTAL